MAVEFKKIVRRGKTYLYRIAPEDTNKAKIQQFLLCLRCRHTWIPRRKKMRKLNLPGQCPQCHSDLWNIPRQNKKR